MVEFYDESRDPITLPTGVILRHPEDFTTLRRQIYNTARERMSESFPTTYNGVRMELHDLDYADPEDVSIADQKKAMLEDRSVSRRLRGTMRLINDETGDLLDERSMTLMRVPHLTERGSFINNGKEYASAHQARLMHGVFSRKQNNGELESQFNVRPGTGPAFRVGFEPATAQYRFRVRGSNLHMYSMLHDLGVPDDRLESMWGPEILKVNRDKYDPKVFPKAYQHLVPARLQVPDADMPTKAAAVRDALDAVKVDRGAVARTLPAMLGKKQAAAWRAGIGVKSAAITGMAFGPDLRAGEAALQFLESVQPDIFFSMPGVVKFASADFKPDLTGDDMQGAYDAIYAHAGPRLAGMREWPAHWFPPGSDPLGWVSWYIGFEGGKRTDDDTRQMNRWKLFKSRNGAQFVKNPTARRAFALRYWAIDPMTLLTDDEQKRELQKDMDAFRKAQMDKFHENSEPGFKEEAMKKSASAIPLHAPDTDGPVLQLDPWFPGVVKAATDARKGREFQNCLMAMFGDSDAAKVVGWASENIPEDQLAGDGFERECHTTILFGLASDVTHAQVEDMVREASPPDPMFVFCGAVKRFPANERRPGSDVLVIECDSPALYDLNASLREQLGDRVRVTYPDFLPHCTLAYVKPGALKHLDGHQFFDGMCLPVASIIYFNKSRSEKLLVSIPHHEAQ